MADGPYERAQQSAEDKAAVERLDNLESQLTLYERGQVQALVCPYCHATTESGGAFCCPTMMGALEAILDRRETEDQMAVAAKIADKASSQISTERAEDILKSLR